MSVLSSAFAGEATLAWDPNGEPDLAGYRLHYGSASGAYEQTIDVGNRTEATVSELTGGGTYFFAVTAYNTAGLESSHSNEVFTTIANPAPLPPDVALTSPPAGAKFAKQTQVMLTAAASDADGTIARVEFCVNGIKVGEDADAPYAVAWSSKSTGVFTVIARAIDDAGLATDSVGAVIEITGGGKGSGGGDAGGGKPGGGKTTKYGAATYSALVPSSDPETAYAASISLTTTADGSYSGKVKHSGVTYSVKGRLDKDGKAVNQIARKGAAPLTLKIGTADSETGELTGTLDDESGSAEFLAKPGSGKSSQSQRSSGRWSVLLPVQEAAGAETPFPQGTGIASLVVTKKGAVRISGTLADGTPFSQGGRLSSDGELLVYIPLYGKRGLLAGSVIFPTADGEIAAGGTAEWIKPAAAGGKRLYPAGFHLKLEVMGEAVGAAPAGLLAAARAAVPAADRELTLFAGDLPEPVVRTFLPAQSSGPQTLAGQERLKISMRPDGRFSGSFDDTGKSTRRRFIGAYLPTHAVGAGFFLGSHEAGGVILEPVQ